MKIGFIDYYLDEWHANNYITWIFEHSNGEMEVKYAYGMINSPRSGMTSEEWCRKYQVEYCRTIEEIVEKSDALMILAPENAETHEALSELSLKSGKKTYIDKTFAPDKKTAEAIFALAEQNGTPCYSTSALRYATEYQSYVGKKINAAVFIGASDYNNYSIHHIEPIVMMMKGQVRRVMALTKDDWTELVLEWDDGRIASMICTSGGTPFTANLLLDDECETVEVKSDFFRNFIDGLVHFFKTGEIPVPHEKTVRIIAIREAGLKAMKCPGEWVVVE